VLDEELAETKAAVAGLWCQVDGLCQEVSNVSGEVRATLRLLLTGSRSFDDDVEQLRPARAARHDRAAVFCRGFSETSAAEHCNSPKCGRYIFNESTSSLVCSAHRRPASILRTSTTNASRPPTRRIETPLDSGSRQSIIDGDNALTQPAKNNNAKQLLAADDDNMMKPSTSPAAPATTTTTATACTAAAAAAVRHDYSPDIIKHHMVTVGSTDGHRPPQTQLTTSTMKRVDKFRRRAAAAASTTPATYTDL